MPASVKVVIDHREYRNILRSRGAEREVRRKADRIARAAGPGNEVDSRIGANRARATVFTATMEARVAEARYHRLLRAIDAGRG